MTKPHATIIVGTTLAGLVSDRKLCEKDDGRTPSGWPKELENDISMQGLLYRMREYSSN